MFFKFCERKQSLGGNQGQQSQISHFPTTKREICLSFPAPTAPPGKVFVTAASPTSLLVSWSSVPEQHRHGNISQYNVYISPANKKNDSFNVLVYNSTQSYVDDLQIYTPYVIRVSAANDIGEGPKSRTFTARTMARGRPITLVRK